MEQRAVSGWVWQAMLATEHGFVSRSNARTSRRLDTFHRILAGGVAAGHRPALRAKKAALFPFVCFVFFVVKMLSA
jgi:hypothetical protein